MCSLPYTNDSGHDDISMTDEAAAAAPDQDLPDQETAQASPADQSAAASRTEAEEGEQSRQEVASVQLQMQDLALQHSDDDNQGKQTIYPGAMNS